MSYPPPCRTFLGIPSWKSVHTSQMTTRCFIAFAVCVAPSAQRYPTLSVVAVPKVRDPTDGTGARTRVGHGPGQQNQEQKQMENMERYQQERESENAALTLTMRARGDLVRVAARRTRAAPPTPTWARGNGKSGEGLQSNQSSRAAAADQEHGRHM